MMTVVDLVARNGRIYPDSIAYVEVRPVSKVRKEITWASFNERVNRIAHVLIAKGIKRGMKVSLLGRNSINWLATYFGILAAGAWVIPLNFRFTDEDIRYCAGIGEPGVFIFDEEFAERINSMKADLTTVGSLISIGSSNTLPGIESLEALMENVSAAPAGIELNDEDECALYFTSGTTGAPKAVLHAHRSLMVSAITEATCHEWRYGDNQLMMPPLYHLAIGHLLGGLIVGGTNVLLTELIKPDIIVETLAREKCTIVFLLVPWALDILGAFDRGEVLPGNFDLSNLRLVQMGAQPIPVSLIKRWKVYFPNTAYDTTYGLSEGGGPGVTHLGTQNESKIGAIGRPSLIWDVRVVKDNGTDVEPDEVGEIIVKGSGIMKGYYKNPEATAQTVRNGWVYTGDLAKIDDDGFIYIVDRKKDLVISGGENIYPVEIEAAILKHPKVHDVAVIGVPDERLGEVVAAVIAPLPGAVITIDEMKAYCEENLPRYKRPRHFIFAPVPRSATGKIEKPRLRAAYAKGGL